MELKTFLQALEQRHGTGPLETDSEGCCCLSLDDVDVDLFPVGGLDAILALSEVADLPEEGRGELAEKILAANLDFPDPSAAFSLDTHTGAIVLQTLLAGSDPDELAALLLAHAGRVRQWRADIVQQLPGQQEPPEGGSEFVPESWIPA